MKALVNSRERSCRAIFLAGAILIVLILAVMSAPAQFEMTHEELMRRARGLPAATTTNVAPPATPVVIVPAPASPRNQPVSAPVAVVIEPGAENIPAWPVQLNTPPRSNAKKTKASVFSEVPDENFNPAPTSVPAPINAMETLDEKYRLAIGDRLSFRIVEDEEGPKSLTVTDSGELEMPHIGRFRGVGRTCRELAQALKAEFEKEYYYQATVIIAVDSMTRSRGKVYLVGPVRSPGPLEVPSDEVLTLSKAVLRAGGFTDFADRRNVKVTRKAAPGREDETFTVNVADILEKGKTDSDLPLEPGDLIYVQERLIRF